MARNVYATMLTHCNVNLLCDGELKRYRYGYNEQEQKRGWHCDGEYIQGMTSDIYKGLKEKYTSIKVKWCRQF